MNNYKKVSTLTLAQIDMIRSAQQPFIMEQINQLPIKKQFHFDIRFKYAISMTLVFVLVLIGVITLPNAFNPTTPEYTFVDLLEE